MGKVKILVLCLASLLMGGMLYWYFVEQDQRQRSVEKRGVVYTASVLAAQEMALQEASMLQLPEQRVDSLASRYRPSTLVDLEIDLSGLQGADVSGLGAESEEDFNARYYLLHFRIQELISLKIKEQEYQPVLTQATIQPSINQLKIRLTFPLPQEEFLAAGGSLKFSDPFFTQEDITFDFN